MKIKYKLDPGAYAPIRAHRYDAGWDIRTPKKKLLTSGSNAVIDTGIHVQIPEGFYIEVCNKSGLNVNKGITLHGSGTIDCGYTGSIHVKLYNNDEYHHMFEVGDKIAQMIIHPFTTEVEWEEVDELEQTERGDGGFGSTGR